MRLEGQHSSDLCSEIQKEYNKFIDLILKVDVKDRTKKVMDGTTGKVSVSDLIAYQIGWGNVLITWYDCGLTGKTPEMPGEGFQKWDCNGLANTFYKKHQFDQSQKQLKEFYRIVIKILEFVEYEASTGHLDAIGIWLWCTLPSGKRWPLSKWIKVNTASPYKKASALIRKAIKTDLANL